MPLLLSLGFHFLIMSSFFLLINVCLSKQSIGPSTSITLSAGHWQQTTILCTIHCLWGSGYQGLLVVLWPGSIVQLFSAGVSPEPFSCLPLCTVSLMRSDISFLGNLPLERLLPGKPRGWVFGKQSMGRSGLLSHLVLWLIRNQTLFPVLNRKLYKSIFIPEVLIFLWSIKTKYLTSHSQGKFPNTECKKNSNNSFVSLHLL